MHCPNCGERSEHDFGKPTGSAISVIFKCNKCPKEQKWHSQPMIKEVIKRKNEEKGIKTDSIGKPQDHKIRSGNIDLAASICFSGASATEILRVLEQAGIQAYSKSTYFEYQKKYLHPTVYSSWRWEQEVFLNEVRINTDGDLVLGGDGRADTPGHSAKFGTYSCMDLNLNKIVDLNLVQVCAYKYTYLPICIVSA